jgi:nucleoside-diphosphate-sugar epimerase
MKNYWKNKKVLVTGASGFIGSHAVEALVKKNAIVTAVVSKNISPEKIKKTLGAVKEKIVIKKADLLSLKDCLAITKNQQVILNFAAMDGGVYFKMNNPAKIFRTNSQIVLNMLEASVVNKVERFLLTSSIEVYPKNLPTRVNERHGFREGLETKTEGYAWSKRFGETAARMYYKEYSLPVTIARFGNVYGPRDYADDEKGRVIPRFIRQSLQGENITIVGNGLQERSFIYVEDLLDTVFRLIETYAVGEPVNVAGAKSITIKDLAQLIINLVGNTNSIVFKDSEDTFSKKRKISIVKVKKITDFKEKESIESGLIKTIEYFRSII